MIMSITKIIANSSLSCLKKNDLYIYVTFLFNSILKREITWK